NNTAIHTNCPKIYYTPEDKEEARDSAKNTAEEASVQARHSGAHGNPQVPENNRTLDSKASICSCSPRSRRFFHTRYCVRGSQVAGLSTFGTSGSCGSVLSTPV